MMIKLVQLLKRISYFTFLQYTFTLFRRKYQRNNQTFVNFQDLVEAILSCSDQQGSCSAISTSNSPYHDRKKLEEIRRCKKCHKEDACVVFIPCGHLACCVKCAEGVNLCPICKEDVKEKIRSYIS